MSIDFATAPPQVHDFPVLGSKRPDIDFDCIAEAALAQAETLLASWFPAGRLEGREFVVGDVNGTQGRSLSVNLDSGVWKDFATGEGGSDLISLLAARLGVRNGEAARELALELGVSCASSDASVRRKNSRPIPKGSIQAQKPEHPKTPPVDRHPRLGTPSMTWAYHDASGQLVGAVCRFDGPQGKEIRPQVYEPGKGWVWKSMPTLRPLYQLPQLLQAPDKPVLLVEGEKAADAAQRLLGEAWAVTTWPHGAQSIGKADFSPLVGRRVTVWPDHDKPGFEAALKLAGILEQVGVRELAFAIPHAFIDQGWDAADLEAEGAEITASVHWDAGLGDLRRAARDRFQIEVPEAPAPSAPRFELLDVGSMLSRPPEPIRWLLKDSLPLGQVGLLAAQGGTGKSMLLLQLALAVASSSLPSPVKGIFDVAEHGPVLAVFAEDNERMLRGRLWDAYGRFQEPGQGEGIVPAPRASEGQLRKGLNLIAGAGLDLRLVHEELGRRDASQVFKDLLDLAASIAGLKLIVLDPLARLFSGQENDNSQATHFCALVELLARETGAAVILAHHTSKASGSDKSKPEERLHQGAARGASGFVDAARWVLSMTSLTQAESRSRFKDYASAHGHVAWKLTKCNWGPPGRIEFLRRTESGILVPAKVDQVAAEQILEAVVELLREYGRMTLRNLTRDHLHRVKDRVEGTTRARIEEAVQVGLQDGVLEEVTEINQSGRETTYLTCLEPADIPAGAKPAKAAKTELPVCK